MTETSNAVSEESAQLIGLRASLVSLSADCTDLVARNAELERLGRELVDSAQPNPFASARTIVLTHRVDALTVLLDQCLADRAAGR